MKIYNILTADTKSHGAGPVSSSIEGEALRAGEAGAVQAGGGGALALAIGEPDDGEE